MLKKYSQFQWFFLHGREKTTQFTQNKQINKRKCQEKAEATHSIDLLMIAESFSLFYSEKNSNKILDKEKIQY